VPALYFLGLQWQYTRGSALLGWVKDDAEYIAGRIGAFESGQTRRSSLATTQAIARTEASEAEVPALT
jgi:putative flavoprotein involved in K+ transport